MPLSLEELKSRLLYEPMTGLLVWREDGGIAGHLRADGYIRVKVAGELYYAQQLIFFYMTGEWTPLVDHRNRIRSDNRWDNLRAATRSQNRHNSGQQQNNSSGQKGVKRNGNSWTAQLMVNGTRQYLGTFATFEQAVAVRLAAEEKHLAI